LCTAAASSNNTDSIPGPDTPQLLPDHCYLQWWALQAKHRELPVAYQAYCYFAAVSLAMSHAKCD